MISNDLYQQCDLISKVLLRCFVLCMGILVLWLVGYFVLGDFGYATHSQWFELTAKEYSLMNYYGMAAFKVLSIALFGIPYFALRWAMKGQKPAE